MDKHPPTNARDVVQSLVWEDSTCYKATKPVRHKRSHHNEEPTLKLEKARAKQQRTNTAKINQSINFKRVYFFKKDSLAYCSPFIFILNHVDILKQLGWLSHSIV